MTNAVLIAAIYAIGGSIFLAGFFLAVVTTGARALWYLRHQHPAPRLLTRDIIVKGGMFASFGLITLVRFLSPEQRLAFTLNNVPWAVVTTIPAVIAILVYCAYELFVIPKAAALIDDELALESSVQTNIELTREGIVHAQAAGDKADAAYHEANSVNAKIATLTELVGHKEDKA